MHMRYIKFKYKDRVHPMKYSNPSVCTRLVIYYNISCNQPIKTKITNTDGELAWFFLLNVISFKALL